MLPPRPRRLALKANAKVNLHLEVGNRRRDGYHDLRTLFQEISLHDDLSFAVTPSDLRLSVTPARVPTGADNLVVRALAALRRALRTSRGMSVRLRKRVPIGAGLGGGSADAAAALRAGWALWKNRGRLPSRRRVPPLLLRLARKLGADVAFFLRGGTAWGEGIGEKLTAVPGCPRRWMVLVYPRVHVSTALAYQLLDRSRRSSRPGARRAPQEKVFRPLNSFEPVVTSRFPAVRKAREALAAAGCAGVMMSGSGSAMFGFARDRRDARRIALRLRRKPWDVFVVRTVPGCIRA